MPADPYRGPPDLNDAALTGLIARRAVSDEIVATGEYQVAAVDVFGRWAAVFRFSLSESGEVDTETDIAGLGSDGSWGFYTGGGMRSGGWEVPWSRPDDGWWDGDHLITFGTCGMDVEVDGEDLEITAVCGFASGETDAIQVTTRPADRVVVPSRTGAFVAVGLGRGPDLMTVTPMKDGVPLNPARRFPRRGKYLTTQTREWFATHGCGERMRVWATGHGRRTKPEPASRRTTTNSACCLLRDIS
jgi:hypothetical protein